MAAESKNGEKAIERLHPITESVIQPIQTATDTGARGPMCMININITYSDHSFRDFIPLLRMVVRLNLRLVVNTDAVVMLFCFSVIWFRRRKSAGK